jgi:hypothetical protein
MREPRTCASATDQVRSIQLRSGIQHMRSALDLEPGDSDAGYQALAEY